MPASCGVGRPYGSEARREIIGRRWSSSSERSSVALIGGSVGWRVGWSTGQGEPLDEPVRLTRALGAICLGARTLLGDARRHEAEQRRALGHRRLDRRLPLLQRRRRGAGALVAAAGAHPRGGG